MASSQAAQLTAIIQNERLDVVFQPIVDLARQNVRGYEALVRGPEETPLHSPVALFREAERSGQLVELDLLCRRLAIRAFASMGLPGQLFLNVIPATIVERDFEEGLTLRYLETAGLPPSRVVIELTEHMPIHDYSLMRRAMAHYRDMGFQVALDDLGAGHSSLRHWAELRPDFVKLDRHFVSGIDTVQQKREFLRSIIDVSRSLRCELIVEGVETAEEQHALWELDRGLCLMQGYYFARPSPMPPHRIDLLLPGMAHEAPQDDVLARRLMIAVTPVEPSTPVLELAERFRREPGLRCVPVVAAGRPLGAVWRNKFLTLFTNPYSHSLYARRQVHEIAETRLLIVAANTPLMTLSQQVTSSQDVQQEDVAIVDGEGRYLGMVNIIDLLREITAIQVRRARHANPLTGLPGNLLIQETLAKWLRGGKPFVVVYVDLDNFKAYNDGYGYARGDRIILALAELLQAVVDEGDFVGHVGGDDFMLLLGGADWRARCETILERFEALAPEYYDQDDRKAGGIYVENRQKQPIFAPFVSLSLAVRPVAPDAVPDSLTLSSELSELKHQAKERAGNSLFVDRRHADPRGVS